MTAAERQARYAGWRQAVTRALLDAPSGFPEPGRAI